MRSTVAAYADENMQSYVLTTRQLIDSELERLLSEISEVKLRPLLEYALLSEGKRLRPILTVLSAQSVGGNPKKVTRLALAFELLHTATLVHDDIIDHDALRRGMKTLYSKWSMSDAVLAGDALIALSINLAADYGAEIMKIVSNVGLELCDGEHIDVSLSLEDATESDYFTKIRKKSASLFKAVTRCGALMAEGKPLEVEALTEFGECFGMAYQVNDDLIEVLSGNQISQDLLNGNVTLPFLYVYEHGDDATRGLLRKGFGNKNVTVAIAQEIRGKMEEIGAFRVCQERIREYSRKAVDSLQVLRESEYKRFLTRLPDYLPKTA